MAAKYAPNGSFFAIPCLSSTPSPSRSVRSSALVGGRRSSSPPIFHASDANVKRPFLKGVSAVFFATSSLREPSSASVAKQARTAIQW